MRDFDRLAAIGHRAREFDGFGDGVEESRRGTSRIADAARFVDVQTAALRDVS